MKNSAQIALAFITVSGFFFCIFFLFRWDYPAQNKDALYSLLGVLTTIFTLQMNYFFGSTSASKAKDDTIGAMAAAAPTNSSVVVPDAKDVSVTTAGGDVNINPK